MVGYCFPEVSEVSEVSEVPPEDRAGLARHLDSWSPAPVTARDVIAAAPVAALGAVLDQDTTVAGDGEEVPPLWHWLHFLDRPAQRELGADGHPAHGHFLPPIPDRRRMFAGGRAEFTAPLRVGAAATRTSSLAKTEIKQGKTGEMAFVTVRHEIGQGGQMCVVEEQDLVYRSGEGERRPTGSALDLADADAEAEAVDVPWQLALRPSPTLLFRYSALTANAHRIHYDQPYARDVEGYPGLVVHGPLLVMLMLELARRNAPLRQVRSLSYRLRKPVFAGEHVLALGGPASEGDGSAQLRIATRREERHATAEVGFA